MAQNPDPTTPLTTLKGVTRTLDDWLTVFNMCLIALPGRPEAQAYVKPGRHILDVFSGADVKTAFLVTGADRLVHRVLGDAVDQYVVFVDPDAAVVKAMGLTRLPAFVHLASDCTVVNAAEGWDPETWTRAAKELAADMAWTYPVLGGPGDPPPHPGWSP